MSFLRRRSLILKAVLSLTALFFMVGFLTTNSGTSNLIIALSRKFEEPKPYGNNLSDDLGVIAAPGLNNEPGHLGQPVVLSKNITRDIRIAISKGWKQHFFNQYVSDLISIRRKIPDPRNEWCKKPDRYLDDLPQTSVVICFYNEAWSVLLRTVHSVLDRSPAHLLREIILVDDLSNMTHLMQKLDDYMSTLPKVKIVRATRREGLIRARLLGARYVTAPVLTYLDSHCECTEGWLEPLLDRIARNKTTVVCPVIDIIDSNTFEYYYSPTAIYVGGFNWMLENLWHPVPPWERSKHQNIAEPVWSPTMFGCVFAIDKKFFERLGTYDSDFDIWGGENLELSFKTWMCGGTLEFVPCSHVGHLFRKPMSYITKHILLKNQARLAEVWMDDYAKYYYERINYEKVDYGDITGRKQLRKNLGCKSFDWYVKNIYPELFIPGESVAHGEIANTHTKMCLDAAVPPQDLTYPVKICPCHGKYGNQYWMYSKTGEIRRDEACLQYSGHDLVIHYCHGAKSSQLWLYNPTTKLLKHASRDKCIAISSNKDKIVMERCNDTSLHQMWVMENFNAQSPQLMYD